MIEMGLPVRRACRWMKLSRASFQYVGRPDRNAKLRTVLHSLWKPKMGYRMAWARLRLQSDEYAQVGRNRVHRLWRELELSVPVKRTRKLKTGSELQPKAAAPGDVWCLDFVHESACNGQTVRILAVKDEFTRECVALEAASSFPSPTSESPSIFEAITVPSSYREHSRRF